jgi:hypothetical protein
VGSDSSTSSLKSKAPDLDHEISGNTKPSLFHEDLSQGVYVVAIDNIETTFAGS